MENLQFILKKTNYVRYAGNKEKAFQSVRNLIKNLSEEQVRDLQDDLARIYAYFIPPVPKVPKKVFDWAAKAVDPKSPKNESIRYVYVNGRRIIGTDGFRIHVAPNKEGLEDGFYNRNGEKVYERDIFTFPAYESIIPSDMEEGGRRLLEVNIKSLEKGESLNQGKVTHYYKLPIEEDLFIAISVKYLNDAASIAKDGILRYSVLSKTDPVAFDFGEGRIAVIMPMNV